MKYAVIAMIMFLGACAATPRVVDLGDGSFRVTQRAMTGTSGGAAVRAEALQRATTECGKTGKVAQVQTENESTPWYVPGGYRILAVTFRCVPGP